MDKKNFCLADRGGDMKKRWYVYFRDSSGKRIQKTGTINQGKTPEARRQRAELLIEELSKKDSVKSRPDIIREMYHCLEVNGWDLRPASYKTYKGKIRRLEQWMIDYSIKDLTPKEAEAFLRYLKNDEGLHSTTLKSHQVTYDWFFKRLKKSNPFAALKKAKADKRPAMYFTLDQCKELKTIIKAENPQLWLACELLFYCFIRPNEMRYIRIADINLTTNRINIAGASAKNGKSKYVVIPNALRPSLMALGLQSYKSNWYLFGQDSAKPGPDQLFHSYFCRRHQDIIKKHGYNTAVYKHYSWKHSGAVAFINGASAGRSGNASKRMKQLQIQMRHHSMAQTDQYLRSLGIEDLDEIVDEFPTI